MDEAQAINRAADPEQEGRGGAPRPVTVPAAATMEEGLYYRFNFAASPSGGGYFVGWTDFGWLILADEQGQARFYNPALLCTIIPDNWDPERTA